MALIPGHAGAVLDRVRNALTPLKAALDERDSWEVLAAEHERKEVERMAKPRASVRVGGGRVGMGNNSLRMPKVPRSIANRITYDRWLFETTFTTSTSASTFRQDAIAQSNDPNASSWQGIFDSFWIVKAKWRYRSLMPPGQVTAPATAYLAREYNAFTPTSLGNVQQYASSKSSTFLPGKSLTMTVAPCYAQNVGASSTGGQGRGWCNLAIPTIPWYGTVFGISSSGTAYTIQVEVEVFIAYVNGD